MAAFIGKEGMQAADGKQALKHFDTIITPNAMKTANSEERERGFLFFLSFLGGGGEGGGGLFFFDLSLSKNFFQDLRTTAPEILV